MSLDSSAPPDRSEQLLLRTTELVFSGPSLKDVSAHTLTLDTEQERDTVEVSPEAYQCSSMHESVDVSQMRPKLPDSLHLLTLAGISVGGVVQQQRQPPWADHIASTPCTAS